MWDLGPATDFFFFTKCGYFIKDGNPFSPQFYVANRTVPMEEAAAMTKLVTVQMVLLGKHVKRVCYTRDMLVL